MILFPKPGRGRKIGKLVRRRNKDKTNNIKYFQVEEAANQRQPGPVEQGKAEEGM